MICLFPVLPPAAADRYSTRLRHQRHARCSISPELMGAGCHVFWRTSPAPQAAFKAGLPQEDRDLPARSLFNQHQGSIPLRHPIQGREQSSVRGVMLNTRETRPHRLSGGARCRAVNPRIDEACRCRGTSSLPLLTKLTRVGRGDSPLHTAHYCARSSRGKNFAPRGSPHARSRAGAIFQSAPGAAAR